jgi:hypothetical protein
MNVNGFDTMRAENHYKYCIKAEVSLPLVNGIYQGGDDIYLHTNNPDFTIAWARMAREYTKRTGIIPTLQSIFLYRDY